MNSKEEELYIVSSLCYFDGREGGALINVMTNDRFNLKESTLYHLLFDFLQPLSMLVAERRGYDSKLLQYLVENKVLIEVGSEIEQGMSLWEHRNWGRAAYLAFSQSDIKYYEAIQGNNQKTLTTQRRNLMAKYKAAGQYPELYRPEGIKVIQLEDRAAIEFDPAVLLGRSSCRSFLDDDISFGQLEYILSVSTKNIRKAANSKQSGDMFFLLNSFYAWTTIYVLIQGVSGVDRGIYFFDVEKMELKLIREGLEDTEVSNCIQGQEWIRGGGFSLLIGADWDRYSWIYRHSRAYINLLVQIGELSQEFLLPAYTKGLAGWMTLAVTESIASSLCQVQDDNVDLLYFMKFGNKKH